MCISGLQTLYDQGASSPTWNHRWFPKVLWVPLATSPPTPCWAPHLAEAIPPARVWTFLPASHACHPSRWDKKKGSKGSRAPSFSPPSCTVLALLEKPGVIGKNTIQFNTMSLFPTTNPMYFWSATPLLSRTKAQGGQVTFSTQLVTNKQSEVLNTCPRFHYQRWCFGRISS